MKTLRLTLALALAALLARNAAACVPNWVATKTGRLASDQVVRAADLNNDGLTDVIGFWDIFVRVVLVTPDGFAEEVEVARGDYISDVAVADVHNDGKLDLILADTGTNTIGVLPGNGDGTFGAIVKTSLPIAPTRILVRDFTGDGKADIALRSYSASTISILQGNGANGFTELARTPLHEFSEAFGAGDFDDDGLLDLVVPYVNSTRVDVLFGNGNGTFDPAVQIIAAWSAVDVAVGDLDNDGDDDFATADWTDDTMTAVRHVGTRTFSVATYDASLRDDSLTDPTSIQIADVSQDGYADVVLAAVNARSVVTFLNHGNGTFRDKLSAPVGSALGGFNSGFPTAVLAGQFAGDARVDLLVAGTYSYRIAMLPNNCGASYILVLPQMPLISVGQDAEVVVRVQPPGSAFTTNPTLIYPTGTVTVMHGDTPAGSATLGEQASALITISGLPAGEQSLEVVYSGDENYDPTTSEPFIQKVTTETTTTTITPSTDEPTEYGEVVTFTASVTASGGGTPQGGFDWFVDGVAVATASDFFYPPYRLNAGTHTVQARYSGSENHPASLSNIVTITVLKSTIVSMTADMLTSPVRTGSPITFRVFLETEHSGGWMTGFVRLYEGSTLVQTNELSGSTETYFNLAARPPGTYTFRAVYSGDENFYSHEIGGITISVLPDVVLPFHARGGTAIVAEWIELASNLSYQVQRRVSGVWQNVGAPIYGNTYTFPNPQPNTVYALRVQAFNGSGTLMQTSAGDVAMLTSFTDDPPGIGTTKIRALHVSELLQTTNTLRAAAGLGPVSLSGAGVGQTITAAHLNTLRTAINDGRTAHGAAAVTFTDTLAAGTTRIKALHVQELREALR